MLGLYRVAHKYVNRKHSLVLTGMFSFKPVITGNGQLYALFLILVLQFSISTIFINSVSD
jgi:hypothetical protein